MTKILTQNPDRFLPITTPWETAGGSAEQSTILFLRGCILSSFGMVEMQLKQIAFGCSSRDEYCEIRKKAPWKRLEFLKYIKQVAIADGPVKISGVSVDEICDEFESQFEIRDCWAHGHLVVLPGSLNNRWEGAWITLKSMKTEKDQIKLVENRWTYLEIESQAERAKTLADKCNLAFSALGTIVPLQEITN